MMFERQVMPSALVLDLLNAGSNRPARMAIMAITTSSSISVNAPGFGGNGVVSISGSTDFTNVANFGAIGSTRNAPNDPRQIQFAVKLYY